MGRNFCENRRTIVKGEVYFIKCGNLYKIGATKDLYTRFHAIQTTNPTKCELIHSIKSNDMYMTERLFKCLFNRLNAQGEWFSLSPNDLAYIKAQRYSEDIQHSIGHVAWTHIPDILAV